MPMPAGTTPEDLGVSLAAAARIDRESGQGSPYCYDHEQKIRAAMVAGRAFNDPRVVLAR